MNESGPGMPIVGWLVFGLFDLVPSLVAVVAGEETLYDTVPPARASDSAVAEAPELYGVVVEAEQTADGEDWEPSEASATTWK